MAHKGIKSTPLASGSKKVAAEARSTKGGGTGADRSPYSSAGGGKATANPYSSAGKGTRGR